MEKKDTKQANDDEDEDVKRKIKKNEIFEALSLKKYKRNKIMHLKLHRFAVIFVAKKCRKK